MEGGGGEGAGWTRSRGKKEGVGKNDVGQIIMVKEGRKEELMWVG